MLPENKVSQSGKWAHLKMLLVCQRDTCSAHVVFATRIEAHLQRLSKVLTHTKEALLSRAIPRLRDRLDTLRSINEANILIRRQAWHCVTSSSGCGNSGMSIDQAHGTLFPHPLTDGQRVHYYRGQCGRHIGEIIWVAAPHPVTMRDGRTTDVPLSYIVAPDDGFIEVIYAPYIILQGI